MGLFTSRSGELLRRTTASLEVPMVRGRMAQVALGVFGHMNSCSMSGGGGGPISVAHFADGSQRELRAGMEWDKAVTEGSRSGSLLALAPFAAPLATPANQAQGLLRLRNSARVVASGSQIGKTKNNTMRVVAAESIAATTPTAAYAAGTPGSLRAGVSTPGGANSSVGVALLPSRSADTNRRLDTLTAQLVKILEGTGGSKKQRRIRQISVDYVIQIVGNNGQDNEALPAEGDGKRGKEQRVGARRAAIEPTRGDQVIWMERVVSVEVEEARGSAMLDMQDGEGYLDSDTTKGKGPGEPPDWKEKRSQREREEVYRQHKLQLENGMTDDGDGNGARPMRRFKGATRNTTTSSSSSSSSSSCSSNRSSSSSK